eukprot:Gregarina_sp_Pseudo_9__5998@NODE_992_length_1994_cov_20_218414_g930_i0_p1_GENE_NODE_992_length_1994_cov_20_218414_g930_i0NODE_992_length_1994_cov_20_218414_g930_i0_p1_ORF_typecomplete_len368_score66_47Branch/PF02485_21/5_5e10_NODE_992_length_1994_cov_20_218414_g930_i06891792
MCRHSEFERAPSTDLGLTRAARATIAPVVPASEREGLALGLLFLTTRGLTTNTLWERWLRDAHDHINRDLQVPIPQALQTFVAYAPAFEPSAVQEFLPPSLRESLIAKPVGCAWAEALRNERAMLEEAMASEPRIGYFVVVSHNSIPVKSFATMYEDFLADSRIRMSLAEWDIGVRGLFKTANWRAFPRRMAEIMLRDSDYPQTEWLHFRDGVCGPDECRVWEPLVRALSEDLFDEFRFVPSSKAVPLHGLPAHYFFDCWNDDIYGCPATASTGWPRLYRDFDNNFLDNLIEHPHVWMFRKSDDSTTVGGNIPLVDYVSRKLGSNHSDIHVKIPRNNELPTIRSQGVTYNEQVKFWRQHGVYGLRPE